MISVLAFRLQVQLSLDEEHYKTPLSLQHEDGCRLNCWHYTVAIVCNSGTFVLYFTNIIIVFVCFLTVLCYCFWTCLFLLSLCRAGHVLLIHCTCGTFMWLCILCLNCFRNLMYFFISFLFFLLQKQLPLWGTQINEAYIFFRTCIFQQMKAKPHFVHIQKHGR